MQPKNLCSCGGFRPPSQPWACSPQPHLSFLLCLSWLSWGSQHWPAFSCRGFGAFWGFFWGWNIHRSLSRAQLLQFRLAGTRRCLPRLGRCFQVYSCPFEPLIFLNSPNEPCSPALARRKARALSGSSPAPWAQLQAVAFARTSGRRSHSGMGIEQPAETAGRDTGCCIPGCT